MIAQLFPFAVPLLLIFSFSYAECAPKQVTKGHTMQRNSSFLDSPPFEKSATEMETNFNDVIKMANQRLDAIAQQKDQEITFQTSAVALDDVFYDVRSVSNRIQFLGEVSPDKALREKSRELTAIFEKWNIDVESRGDLFKVLDYCSKKCKVKKGEEALLLERMTRDYKRAGLHLPEEQQTLIKNLKKEISDLELNISINISKSNNDSLSFTAEELSGLSPENLNQLGKDQEGNYKIRVGVQAETSLVLENASREETRKKVFLGLNRLATQVNPPLMKQVVQKRFQLAQLLGYKSWADYKTEVMMVKTGDHALSFISDLSKRLDSKFKQELETLRQLKVQETKDQDSTINSWDMRYFQQKHLAQIYNIDLNGLKKYFELNAVLEGMFRTFEHSFRLKIEYVKNPEYLWHTDVRVIKISDAKTREELGLLYLDLFPRPEDEKYGHFAMFTIRPGKKLSDGRYHRPASALVCNFPRPTAETPSLLSFDRVQTLFHEFGHGLHDLLTKSNYARFAGSNTVHDFVEAPSQLLERWTLDKGVLDTFAKNYQNPSEKIPADILDKMSESELSKMGAHYRRQFAFALMDLKLHGPDIPKNDFDIVDLTNQVLKETYLANPEGSTFISGFGHLFGGYDAGYYGYAWSDHLAADLASLFEQSPQKFLDKKLGLRLRNEIYKVGGSRDENISVESFLKRKPSIDSFLKKLGIEPHLK